MIFHSTPNHLVSLNLRLLKSKAPEVFSMFLSKIFNFQVVSVEIDVADSEQSQMRKIKNMPF